MRCYIMVFSLWLSLCLLCFWVWCSDAKLHVQWRRWLVIRWTVSPPWYYYNRNGWLVLFADFSSAFNTMQPHILAKKLLSTFGLENHLVLWIIDFLTNRSQSVFVNARFSYVSRTCTGSPQGCVLSPFLYILYAYDCRSTHQDRYLICRRQRSAVPASGIWAGPWTRLNWVCWLVRQLIFTSKCD